MNHMKDLEKTGPNLSKVKSQNAYRVPENYFEEFPRKLMERLEGEDSSKRTTKYIWTYFKPHLAIAATILAFAIISYTTVQLFFSDGSTSEFSNMEIAEYVEYYSSELDESMYYELLDEIHEEETTQNNYDEMVIRYLVDQDIDFQTIVEEL